MPLRVSEIALDVQDVDAMERFWCSVLEVEPVREDGIPVLPLAPGVALILLPVPEPKAIKNRMHLDLNPADGDQAGELARLEALGARRVDVGQGEDVSWVVLADPEGNEFCLLRGA